MCGIVGAIVAVGAGAYAAKKTIDAQKEQAAAMQKASAAQNAAIQRQTEALRQRNAPTQTERQEEEVLSGIENRELMRKRLASSRGFGATRLASAYGGAPNIGKKKLLGQ